MPVAAPLVSFSPLQGLLLVTDRHGPAILLYTFKARARNPKQVSIRELFITDPWLETDYFPVHSALNRALLMLDRLD